MRQVILIPDEIGGYTVEVPSLPGCFSHGDTREGSLADICAAIVWQHEKTEKNSDRKVPRSGAFQMTGFDRFSVAGFEQVVELAGIGIVRRVRLLVEYSSTGGRSRQCIQRIAHPIGGQDRSVIPVIWGTAYDPSRQSATVDSENAATCSELNT